MTIVRTIPPKIALFCPQDKDAQTWAQALQEAQPDFDVKAWPAQHDSADYAIVWSPSQAFIDAHAGVKAIFNMGAGVDGVLKVLLPAHIPLVRLEDAGMGLQMAQYVSHAVLGYFRGIASFNQQMHQGVWKPRRQNLHRDFPVGILGLGVLGAQVAASVAALGFPVNGWSQSAKQIDAVQCFTGNDALNDFLAATRILVCLLPLTPQTQNILCKTNLERLQPKAYVINVARGGHLVDEDLIALLDSGHIAGATLDVFRTEPLPADHPFIGKTTITLTPHISALTLMAESIGQISGKIRAMHSGEAISGIVDRSKSY